METGLLKQSTAPWVKQGFYEYLLVVNPDAEVQEKVIAEKQVLYEQYGQDTASKTKPHITVAKFIAREGMEETLIRWMQRIFSRQQSFTVSLNNYSGFPPNTIYLRVQDEMPFKHLANELKVVNNYLYSSYCPPARLVTKPHITVAKRLPESLYIKALMELGSKIFHETFTVNELQLLKKSSLHDTCKVVNVFRLQPVENALFN